MLFSVTLAADNLTDTAAFVDALVDNLDKVVRVEIVSVTPGSVVVEVRAFTASVEDAEAVATQLRGTNLAALTTWLGITVEGITDPVVEGAYNAVPLVILLVALALVLLSLVLYYNRRPVPRAVVSDTGVQLMHPIDQARHRSRLQV